MKTSSFPIFKSKKIPYRKFALEGRSERAKYFKYKAGPEIEKLKGYLKKNTFVAFLLGIKNSGKGTYSKLFMEAIGMDRVAHISIGDVVRHAHHDLLDKSKKKKLIAFLKERYRGFMPIEKVIDVIIGRDTATLLPAEIILALVEREITNHGRKAIFIDGFPRNLDQISYSLYFRALMGYRDDPDFFVFINVPESVIDERIKNRVICPTCKTPRSPKLLRTKEIGYDQKKKEFYLKCDNPSCNLVRMVAKEGDELGIKPIRNRIEMDNKVADTLKDLHGVPKIFLRNSIPVALAKKSVDDYEITPMYLYDLDKYGRIVIKEEPWIIKDEEGVPSHSLLPATVAVSLIKQITKVLGL